MEYLDTRRYPPVCNPMNVLQKQNEGSAICIAQHYLWNSRHLQVINPHLSFWDRWLCAVSLYFTGGINNLLQVGCRIENKNKSSFYLLSSNLAMLLLPLNKSQVISYFDVLSSQIWDRATSSISCNVGHIVGAYSTGHLFSSFWGF